MNALRSLVVRFPLAAYFLLAYAITWGFSFLAAASSGAIAALGGLLFIYGPACAALLVSAARDGSAGVGALLRRLLIWRVGLPRVLFVLFYTLAVHLIVAGVSYAIDGRAPVFFSSPEVPQGSSPLATLPVLFVVLFLRVGLGEELGWRGFALPALLEQRRSAFVSSLILGLLWALWHFHPLNYPILSQLGVWYVLLVMSSAVIYTWVFRHTRGSVLVAALFHAAANSAEYVVPLGLYEPNVTRIILNAGVNWLFVFILLPIFGFRLSRRGPASDSQLPHGF